MKRLFGIVAVLFALCFPAMAQSEYPDRDRGYAGQWQGSDVNRRSEGIQP